MGWIKVSYLLSNSLNLSVKIKRVSYHLKKRSLFTCKIHCIWLYMTVIMFPCIFRLISKSANFNVVLTSSLEQFWTERKHSPRFYFSTVDRLSQILLEERSRHLFLSRKKYRDSCFVFVCAMCNILLCQRELEPMNQTLMTQPHFCVSGLIYFVADERDFNRLFDTDAVKLCSKHTKIWSNSWQLEFPTVVDSRSSHDCLM